MNCGTREYHQSLVSVNTTYGIVLFLLVSLLNIPATS
jgi:hypothetical protein